MFVKFGTKQMLFASHDPYPFQCPSCKQLGTVDFALSCAYFHIWYIPVFPTEKDGTARCSNCDLRIDSLKFNRNTRELFSKIRKQHRYPFYLYTGITLFLLPVMIGLVLMVFDL